MRTQDANHKQPDAFTREEFWQHTRRVYKDVYSRPQNTTGSILLFGCVAKERHAASSKEAERAEHHHCPCYTSEQHYWKPVAKRSLERGVKLHAACHNGYTMMYVYVKCSSPKKPAAELDPDIWMSPHHPRGKVLQDLLEIGVQATRRFHSGKKTSGETSRFRAGDIFDFVKETGVKTLQELRARAHSTALQGDKRLAEFCTVHKDDDLQKFLNNAWAVHEAPQRALDSSPDRVAKLRQAATWPCTCGGLWTPRVVYVLRNKGEDVKTFCSDVYEALLMGACRGVNMAIIGPPGCGKSTVFEALDLIFVVTGKPQRDHSFALAGVLDAEVLLWQEFTWEPKVCAFEDLMSLMAGEKFGIREPGKKPRQFRNTAPMFYTAWGPLTFKSKDARKTWTYNKAMSERFKIRQWERPLPANGRLPKFPHCACCFASFILTNKGP